MKVFFIRKWSLVVVCVCILAVLCTAFFEPETRPAVATAGKKPIYSVDTSQKKVAISFDAAWGADKTEAIMDILDSKNCKATFFLVGFWAEKYPDKVKSIHNRGFEIGNHSANHPRMSKLTKKQMSLELQDVNKRIEELTGVVPSVFRPPFGDYNDDVVQTVNDMGMHCVQWSIDSLDWKELGVDDMVKRCTKSVKAGDIILFHNNSKYILDALPLILDSLKGKGFEVVGVSELIYKQDYTVDNNGVQHEKN